MIDPQLFREAMARLGGAVSVVTTDGPAGRAGFTATAVCSVTDAPPTLLVCQNRGSGSHAAVTANGVLCVNLLAADQRTLSDTFASRDLAPADRFARAPHDRLSTGSPALLGALASFDCRIVASRSVGTHDVHFCEIVDLRLGAAGDGLVWFARAYHPLPGTAAASAPLAAETTAGAPVAETTTPGGARSEPPRPDAPGPETRLGGAPRAGGAVPPAPLLAAAVSER